jgi:diguanylate cyclase (GGDEF)-like protein
MELKTITYLMIFSGCVTLFLGGWSVKYIKTYGSKSFTALMLCISCYTIGYGFELSSTTLDETLFWANFQYIGISLLPAFYIIFALRYVGKNSMLTPEFYIAVYVIPVITFVMQLTSHSHNLYYIDPYIYVSEHASFLRYSKGPWYIVHMAYINFTLAVGSLLFFNFMRKSAPLFRKQATIMLAGSLVPWFALLAHLSGATFRGIDFTPISITLTAPIWAIALFRYRLFDLSPVARGFVFESMRDGIIVLNMEHRVVDYNPMAGVIFSELDRNNIGLSVNAVFKDYPEICRLVKTDETGYGYINLTKNIGDLSSHFKVHLSPLINLRRVQRGHLLIAYNISEQVRLMDEMHRIASTDDLTGIHNRRHFIALAKTEISRSARFGHSISMIIFDIDHFKDINDQYGHLEGDKALIHVVDIIKKEIRDIDILGRFGGEEFVIILPETGIESAHKLAFRLCRVLAESRLILQEKDVSVTASFGVSGRKVESPSDLEILLRDADEALYRAKNSGRNRVEKCSSI